MNSGILKVWVPIDLRNRMISVLKLGGVVITFFFEAQRILKSPSRTNELKPTTSALIL